LPNLSRILPLASTVRLWCASRVPEKAYFPSVRASIQTASSAVTSTRTVALRFGDTAATAGGVFWGSGEALWGGG